MILLIEDNEAIKDGLKYTLEENNYKVECAKNIKEAKELIETQDLIILDVNLPDGNGFDLYEENIKQKQIPTIFLTARDEESDIVKGLELAEDYITKPFKTSELLIRIKKILLRNKKETTIKIKNITFDIESLKVEKDNNKLDLSSLELNLLQQLIINRGKIVTRDSLLEKIWELTGNDVDDHTLTVYIKRIKDKIGNDIIETIKGMGYRINEK